MKIENKITGILLLNLNMIIFIFFSEKIININKTLFFHFLGSLTLLLIHFLFKNKWNFNNENN